MEPTRNNTEDWLKDEYPGNGRVEPINPDISPLEKASRVKVEINNLFMMYGDPSLTIGEADDRAMECLDLILDGPKQEEK